MNRIHVSAALLAAAALSVSSQVFGAGLTFYVDPSSPWPTGWYNMAVTNMQTVVNEYNAYGDFTGNNGGSIYVYYNAGIPTEQSGYGGSGGSIGVGGTAPNVRVLLHESSHWLGTGTYSAWWGGPAATALIQETDGLGSVLNGDTQHYWPYGENYDSESSLINDARHVAMVYALRQDFGLGSIAAPSSATTVTLAANDAVGTSGFNYPQGWSDGHFPQAGTTYSTGNFLLRTPNLAPSWTFGGDSLTVNNTNGAAGGMQFNGVGTSSVVTFKNLILNGGYVAHNSTTADLFQLGGKVTLLQSPTIDAAQGSINISAAISGSGSFTKAGAYAITLSGNNSYSGATLINAGTLRLTAPSPIANYSFANVSGTTVINGGTGGTAMNGTFNANGGSGSINTSGGPIAGLGALVLNGTGSTVDINSGITDLGGSGTWTVSAWIKTTQAGATILDKGNGSGWVSGYSTFYLGSGNNSGSGGFPDAVRYGGGWVAGGTAVNNGVWHQVTYTDAGGIKAVYVDGVLSSLSQNQFINPDTGSMVRIGFASGAESDGEVATNGSLSGIKFFTSALSATQVQQLYTGARTSSVLPTASNVTIASGAVLDVNGVIQTIGSLTGPSGSAVKLGNGQLTVSSASNSAFAGNIAGTGGTITKSGGGILTLSGKNTYTGSTTINGGTLQLAAPGAVAAATPIASYTFGHLSGNTVINDGSGGSAMNGLLNLNGGSGFINATGGPAAGMGALVLNGSGSTVDITSGVTSLGGTSSWTVSAWIKTTQAGATILDKGDGSTWNSGFSTFYLGNGNNSGSGGLPDAVRWGGGWVAGSTAVNDGTWHLVTYTDSAGTKAIYVDGVLDTLTQNQFNNADTGTKIRIGFAPSTGDGELPTSGSLSGISIYSAALSPSQVTALFTAVAGGSALPTSTDVTVIGGATLDLNGVNQMVGSLSGVAGAAVTLGAGTLTTGSAVSTQFGGAISGAGAVVLRGTGTLTLGGNNSWSGGTTINSGATLAIAAAGALPSGRPLALNGTLNINAESTAGQISGNGVLQLGTTTPANLHLSSGVGASKVGALTINAGSQLDLAGSPLIVQAPDAATKLNDLASLISLVGSGRNNGTWDGSGITSSTVAANAGAFGIAVIDNAALAVPFTTFGGQPVDGNSILVAQELLGDTNIDGHVDLTDLNTVLNNLGTTSSAWTDGNFDSAAAIDLTDLNLVLNNLGASYAGNAAVQAAEALVAGSTPAPEPASLSLFVGAAGGLLLKRRARWC